MNDINKDITNGKAVLVQEIQGLNALADSLGAEFSQTVECLAGIKGRVIVTGMGKSGHVARKIAATMASTGTPAYFVHPAEALAIMNERNMTSLFVTDAKKPVGIIHIHDALRAGVA